MSNQRNDFRDLCASGDVAEPGGPTAPGMRPLSRTLPGRILGVFEQKAHMYIDGIVRWDMLTHCPCTYISHESLIVLISIMPDHRDKPRIRTI